MGDVAALHSSVPGRRGNGNGRELLVVLLLLVVNLALVAPDLMTPFAEVNPYDEAKYVDSGRSLLLLEMRDLSWGPIVAFVYAPLHIVLGGYADWFLLEIWAGRILLYAGLWLATLYLASRFRDRFHPFVAAGILFVSIVFIPVVENQSDAVFVILTCVALAAVFDFLRTKRLIHVGVASLLIGAGVLARVESILLIPILAGLAIAAGRRHHAWGRILATALGPSLAILGIYALVGFGLTGDLHHLDLGGKAWDSFEVNQSVLTGGDLEQGRLETRRLFGTQEENNGSVLRAVSRNPAAFARRIVANIGGIPDSYFAFYGKRLGPALLLLSGWGIYRLFRRREVWPLLALGLWTVPAFVSLAFLPRHLVPQVSYLPIVLASAGLCVPFVAESSQTERLLFTLSVAAFTLVGWFGLKPALVLGGVMMLVSLSIIWLQRDLLAQDGRTPVVPFLIMFAAALILRGEFAYPNYPRAGASSMEQVVHLMQASLPPGSIVLERVPLPALAAEMVALESSALAEASHPALQSPAALCAWLREEDVKGVYLDQSLISSAGHLADLVNRLVGSGLSVVGGSPDSSPVLVVEDPCRAPAADE